MILIRPQGKIPVFLRRPLLSAFLAACMILCPVAAEYAFSYTFPGNFEKIIDFPETFFPRTATKELFSAPLDEVTAYDGEIFREPATGRAIYYFTYADERYIFMNFTFNPPLRTSVRDFPPGKGSYIVRRSRITTAVDEIKIHLKEDPDTYLVLRPDDRSMTGSRMDIVLNRRILQRSIPVSMSLPEILTISFIELAELTRGYVDWGFYLPDPSLLYSDETARLARQIKLFLPYLRDEEDGAMDSTGQYVHISSMSPQEGEGGLNCSGFAKWVIDGLFYPVKGRNTNIPVLKDRQFDVRGHAWSAVHEETRDPFFGLDWSRALALKMVWAYEQPGEKIYNPGEMLSRIPEIDVKTLRYHQYRENVGYPVRELPTLLYELAVGEPDYFYLASISRQTGTDPVLRQHIHVTVFFPFINRDGEFEAIIMERNRLTGIDSILRNYPDGHVHLVRVKAGREFVPPGIIFDPTIRR